jgi:alkylated DNA repair dioxygenase AlkB
MNTLFPVDPSYPDGFSYIPSFITESEEKILYAEILKTPLHNFRFQGFTANRKVAAFGYDYSFNEGTLSKGEEIPLPFHFLVQKVAEHLSIPAQKLSELLVTEYPPGAVINWHRDAPPFDRIAGISIMADCTFKLRPYDKTKQGRKSVISLNVCRRSLYVIHGAARTDWEHSIAPVKNTRYSITLRTLRSL